MQVPKTDFLRDFGKANTGPNKRSVVNKQSMCFRSVRALRQKVMGCILMVLLTLTVARQWRTGEEKCLRVFPSPIIHTFGYFTLGLRA